MSIAIGVAVSTVVLVIEYATVLHPLPYPEAWRIVQLTQPSKGLEGTWPFTYRFFYDFRDRVPGAEKIAALDPSNIILQYGDQEAKTVTSVACSSSLVTLLRAEPQIGRFFDDKTERESSGVSEVVISTELWRSLFGGDKTVLGRQIRLNGQPFVIVGVMPPGLRVPPLSESPSVWLPLGSDPTLGQIKKMFPSSWDRSAYLNVWIRIRLSSNVALMQQQVQSIGLPLAISDDDSRPLDATIQAVSLESQLRNEYRTENVILIATALLVFVMAGSNASTLSLSRYLANWHSFCIRHALGENLYQIVFTILSESLLISLVAGTSAAVATSYLLTAVTWKVPEEMLPFRNIFSSDRVLYGAIVVSVCTALITSFLPVTQLYRLRSGLIFQRINRGAQESKSSENGRQVILLVQLTAFIVSAVLVLYLGLTYRSIMHIPLGFDAEHVVIADLALTQSADTPGESWKHLASEAAAALEGLPGVRSAIAISAPAARTLRTSFRLDPPATNVQMKFIAEFRAVSPSYFTVLGIPVFQGRSFTPLDSNNAPFVCIVNRAFVRKYWGGTLPSAVRVTPTGMHPCEVVGVVGDVISREVRSSVAAAIYVPFDQIPSSVIQGFLSIIVKSSKPVAEATSEPEVYRVIHGVAPTLPLVVFPLQDRVRDLSAPERLRAFLMGLIAVIAAALGASGVYGITGNHIAQHQREITIRVALGAQPTLLIYQNVVKVIYLALVAFIPGVILSLLCIRFLASLLFGFSNSAISILSCVLFLVCVMAALAAYIPSRHILALNPADVLRDL